MGEWLNEVLGGWGKEEKVGGWVGGFTTFRRPLSACSAN